MQDQAVSSNLALFEKLLELYLDSSIDISRPPEMDLVDPDFKINPCHPSLLEKGRDATWLMSTWLKYLKPFYKKFLSKWNKETGGGGRTVSDIPKYCTHQGTSQPWLLWVYDIDAKAGFLLAD